MKVGGEDVCFKSVLHSLFHILGRYHEHQRADREEYVHIMEDNIIEGEHIATCIVSHIFGFACACAYSIYMHVVIIQLTKMEKGQCVDYVSSTRIKPISLSLELRWPIVNPRIVFLSIPV